MDSVKEPPHFGAERFSGDPGYPDKHGPSSRPGICKCGNDDCNLYKPVSGEALHRAYGNRMNIPVPGGIVTVVTNPRRQVGGDHYLKHGDMQPFDIIDAYGLNFYEGTALKYLLRWRDKDGVLDLEKAKHYIEILIQKERSPDGGDLPVPGSPHVTSDPEAPLS